MVDIRVIETSGLGDRSYVASDGEVAVVIDPQRDIDRVMAVVGDVPVTHVFETHIHNDYVSGGLALVRRTGAEYIVNVADDVAFDRTAISDGEVVTTGSLEITAVATPGHTVTHLSFVLSVGGADVAVFTGGSLLFGAMGRTDLVDPDRTEELTRAQYRSAHRLAERLSDIVEVHPTHGFGSFCSATETTGTDSTIGKEKEQNNALTQDEDAFVAELVAGLTAYPRYYAHMGALNSEGAADADLTIPSEVDPAELRRRIDDGQWVVDLRERKAFAAGHLRGTISVELADPFATFLGWTIPWGTPLTLIGDTADQVIEAKRQLVRIGIDDPAGAATGPTEQLAGDTPVATYRRATFEDLAAERERRPEEIVVLDVRRPDEWDEAHIDAAVGIPFYDLEGREHEVPAGELWVHCQSGYRASIGASLMDRAGRRVVHVDDDWGNVGRAGLPMA